jgi:hypothetical protein
MQSGWSDNRFVFIKHSNGKIESTDDKQWFVLRCCINIVASIDHMIGSFPRRQGCFKSGNC